MTATTEGMRVRGGLAGGGLRRRPLPSQSLLPRGGSRRRGCSRIRGRTRRGWNAGRRLGEGRRGGCGAIVGLRGAPSGLSRLAVRRRLDTRLRGRLPGLEGSGGPADSSTSSRVGLAELSRLAGLGLRARRSERVSPALLGVGVGLEVGVGRGSCRLRGRPSSACGVGARLFLRGRPGGKVGLCGAPRAGLSLSARYRTGCGAGNLSGCRLRLGTCGVEQLLVDEDGPGAELVPFAGTGRSGGRRLGCVVVRHEFPLSRVQHHAIPDRPGTTRRHPDRPEANAPTGADSRARSAGSGRRSGFAGSRSSRSPPALPASNPDEHHQRTDGADGGARVGSQRDER